MSQKLKDLGLEWVVDVGAVWLLGAELTVMMADRDFTNR